MRLDDTPLWWGGSRETTRLGFSARGCIDFRNPCANFCYPLFAYNVTKFGPGFDFFLVQFWFDRNQDVAIKLAEESTKAS